MDRRRRMWLGWLGGTALASSLLAVPYVRQSWAQTIPIGGPFSLVDHTGRPVTDKDFRGQLMLIYFGYTYCPDLCPTTLEAMSQALTALGDDAKEVQPLFITVDPERDTVAALAEYMPNFYPSFLGLTGSQKDLGAAVKAYRVHVRRAETGEGDDYLIDHSTFTYLMDREGQFITLFRYGTSADEMAETIRKHL
jgi:protein SCO1